jgi:hypothetical protein
MAANDATAAGHPYELQGVHVVFPYEAYACQKVYMERVIACLQAVRTAPAPEQHRTALTPYVHLLLLWSGLCVGRIV